MLKKVGENLLLLAGLFILALGFFFFWEKDTEMSPEPALTRQPVTQPAPQEPEPQPPEEAGRDELQEPQPGEVEPLPQNKAEPVSEEKEPVYGSHQPDSSGDDSPVWITFDPHLQTRFPTGFIALFDSLDQLTDPETAGIFSIFARACKEGWVDPGAPGTLSFFRHRQQRFLRLGFFDAALLEIGEALDMEYDFIEHGKQQFSRGPAFALGDTGDPYDRQFYFARSIEQRPSPVEVPQYLYNQLPASPPREVTGIREHWTGELRDDPGITCFIDFAELERFNRTQRQPADSEKGLRLQARLLPQTGGMRGAFRIDRLREALGFPDSLFKPVTGAHPVHAGIPENPILLLSVNMNIQGLIDYLIKLINQTNASASGNKQDQYQMVLLLVRSYVDMFGNRVNLFIERDEEGNPLMQAAFEIANPEKMDRFLKSLPSLGVRQTGAYWTIDLRQQRQMVLARNGEVLLITSSRDDMERFLAASGGFPSTNPPGNRVYPLSIDLQPEKLSGVMEDLFGRSMDEQWQRVQSAHFHLLDPFEGRFSLMLTDRDSNGLIFLAGIFQGLRKGAMK